jgi:hypothetical protein
MAHSCSKKSLHALTNLLRGDEVPVHPTQVLDRDPPPHGALDLAHQLPQVELWDEHILGTLGCTTE